MASSASPGPLDIEGVVAGMVAVVVAVMVAGVVAGVVAVVVAVMVAGVVAGCGCADDVCVKACWTNDSLRAKAT